MAIKNISLASVQRLLLFLLLSFVSQAVTANLSAAAELPSLQADPAIREMARAETLSFPELAELSLRASGVDDAAIGSSLRRLEQIHLIVHERLAGEKNLYRKGKRLLTLLHRDILADYDEMQSKIDVLLAQGTYNCVSSGTLYMIMAVGLGLEVQGVIVPDHAFVSVRTQKGDIDVETTTEYGFDPGTVRNFTDAFKEMTGFRYLPPGKYDKREVVSMQRFIGLIYQNRIAVLQRQGDHATAAALAVDRYALDPSSRKDLAGLLRNYISVLAGKKRYTEALVIVDQAEKRYGMQEEMSDAASAMAANAVLSHINEEDYSTARRLLEDHAHLLAPAKASEITRFLLLKELQDAEADLEFDSFKKKVDTAVSTGLLVPESADEVHVELYAREMNRLVRKDELLQPLFLLQSADENLKENRRFRQLLETARSNGVVHYHNAAVSLMAENRFRQALEVIEEGLTHLPGSTTLENDRERLEEILESR